MKATHPVIPENTGIRYFNLFSGFYDLLCHERNNDLLSSYFDYALSGLLTKK